MNVQEALAFPHIVGMNRGSLDLEEGTSLASTRKALETYGHTVKMRPLNSGLHAIIINDDALMGGADPRREGIAIGE